MIYDLEDRTLNFSKDLIRTLKKIKVNHLNSSVIKQLIRSGTSIGANYREANGALTKKEFANRISISKKESKETRYWIEVLAEIENDRLEHLRYLWKEANELIMIFGKIMYKTKENKN
ncbi:four helix bundle protein [Candidatus Falkowbacteria bacterium]|nr:four helix bundle protein [Candidatus Falkowbacteria bacterium]